MVRGTVSSVGWRGYLVKDFMTEASYQLRLPWWMAASTCFLFCLHPTLQLQKVLLGLPTDRSPPDHLVIPTGQVVAALGRRRWPWTIYSNQLHFGLAFQPNERTRPMDADAKLFATGVALVLVSSVPCEN